MSKSELVTAHHLARKAVIYIRQSTPQQVLTNQESTRLQYALQQRARSLGWRSADVEVIDADLGLTATAAEHREGFKELVTRVTLGQVGIILSTEVNRLSRNCSDWYPLLDICGYRGCLIGDQTNVYDPGTMDGRLLLGLKGQLSEVELHTIRLRLTAGLLSKAQRGELALRLPVGLVRDEQGAVHKDPNQEVQHRIELVLQTFLARKSASQVLRFFQEHKLLLPRQNDQGDVVWKTATSTAIMSILKNPAYSGTFVYGRTRSVRQGASLLAVSYKTVPVGEWKICVHDKYPAYISWDTFVKIQTMLQDNYAEYKERQTPGIPRSGGLLLHGIIYCGACGHKLRVQYKQGTRYVCNQLRREYRVPVCQHLRAEVIDAYVVKAFFEVLSPVELDVYTRAVQAIQQSEEKVARARAEQLKRLRYQAALAERQYNRVDPDNRLIAAELEKRWEAALRELRQAEAAAAEPESLPAVSQVLSPEQIEAFKNVGQKLPQLWNQPILTTQHKKARLRCLIDKVVVHRTTREQLQIRIVWKGGATTASLVPIWVGSWTQLSSAPEMERLILERVKAGQSDEEIAQQLTALGYRSARSQQLLPRTVRTIRLAHRLFRVRNPAKPRRVPGYLTAPQIAQALGLNRHWLYAYIESGRVQVKRDPETGLYLFPDTPETLELFKKFQRREINNLRF